MVIHKLHASSSLKHFSQRWELNTHLFFMVAFKQVYILYKYIKAWAALILMVYDDSCRSRVCPDSHTFQVIWCFKIIYFCWGLSGILVLGKEIKYVMRFKPPPLIYVKLKVHSNMSWLCSSWGTRKMELKVGKVPFCYSYTSSWINFKFMTPDSNENGEKS